MFVRLNSGLRRQRRRLAVVAIVLGLAAAVVTAHSVTAADHVGDGVAMCLAVAETAVIAVALVVGVGAQRRRRSSDYELERLACAPRTPISEGPELP